MSSNIKNAIGRGLKFKAKVRGWLQPFVPRPVPVDTASNPRVHSGPDAEADRPVKPPNNVFRKLRAHLGQTKKPRAPRVEIVDPLRDEYHKFTVRTRGLRGLPLDVFVDIETEMSIIHEGTSKFTSEESATSSSDSSFRASTLPTTVTDMGSGAGSSVDQVVGFRPASNFGFLSYPWSVPFDSVVRAQPAFMLFTSDFHPEIHPMENNSSIDSPSIFGTSCEGEDEGDDTSSYYTCPVACPESKRRLHDIGDTLTLRAVLLANGPVPWDLDDFT